VSIFFRSFGGLPSEGAVPSAGTMWRKGYGWDLRSLPGFIFAMMLLYAYFSLTFTIPICRAFHSAIWTAAMDSLAVFNAAIVITVYVYAVGLDAGPVPAKWYIELSSDPVTAKPAGVTLCGHCNEYKPHRAHHCSHCKRCVLRYDHHCDWIDNCVGHANHKFFFLFQFYICFALAHHFYLLVTLAASDHVFPLTTTRLQIVYYIGHCAALGIFTLLTVPLCFFAFLFLFWTTYLLVNNMTSLESETGQTFDEGVLRNVKSVLGTRVWTWFLPLPADPPKCEAVANHRDTVV
jgi:hypothetical protein